jgi:hypothetical protein
MKTEVWSVWMGSGATFFYFLFLFFFVDFVSSLPVSVSPFSFRFFDLKGMKESFDVASRGIEK